MQSTIRITRTQTIIDADPVRDDAAAASFARRRGLVLKSLIAPEALAKAESVWRGASFLHAETSVGARAIEDPPHGGRLIQFLLDRKPLLDWLSRVAATARPITGVTGRIAQLRAGENHALVWHNDAGLQRLLGVTVNLGNEPYEGGHFELRERDGPEILLSHEHKSPGDALVFSIAKGLEHRVTPVVSGGPRTVFTGWFVGEAQ